MRNLLLAFLCFCCLPSFAQDSTKVFDAHEYKPPYSLSMDDWGIERFLIPIEFAPKIKYTGVEDIRFTKGWGDAKTDEYWSYAFLWFLDGKPETNAAVIANNLTAYYNGLIGRNIEKRKIPVEKLIPTKVTISNIKTFAGDIHTFSGKISMLDYMEQKPIILNCIVHYKLCDGQDKTFIFYEISPQALTGAVWQRLDKLWADFKCTL